MKRLRIYALIICFIVVGLHINFWVYFKPTINAKITPEENQQIAAALDIVLDEDVYVTKAMHKMNDNRYSVLITGFEDPLDFIVNNLKVTEILESKLNTLKEGLESVPRKNRLYEVNGYDGFRVGLSSKQEFNYYDVIFYNIDGKYYAEINVSDTNEVIGNVVWNGRKYLTWKSYKNI